MKASPVKVSKDCLSPGGGVGSCALLLRTMNMRRLERRELLKRAWVVRMALSLLSRRSCKLRSRTRARSGWLEVDVTGVAAHGSSPEGVDAIVHAVHFSKKIEDYP